MDYKPLLCRNPQKQGVPGKYYPAPVYEKTIGMNDCQRNFARDFAHVHGCPSRHHGSRRDFSAVPGAWPQGQD